MSLCTWKGCFEFAIYPQVAKDGSVWAELCPEHNMKLEMAITAFATSQESPKHMLSCYIKAKGGAKAAAKALTDPESKGK